MDLFLCSLQAREKDGCGFVVVVFFNSHSINTTHLLPLRLNIVDVVKYRADPDKLAGKRNGNFKSKCKTFGRDVH